MVLFKRNTYKKNLKYLESKKADINKFSEFMAKKGLNIKEDLITDDLLKEYLDYIKKLIFIQKEMLLAKKKIEKLEKKPIITNNQKVDIYRKNGLNVPSFDYDYED